MSDFESMTEERERAAVASADAELAMARRELERLRARVAELEQQLVAMDDAMETGRPRTEPRDSIIGRIVSIESSLHDGVMLTLQHAKVRLVVECGVAESHLDDIRNDWTAGHSHVRVVRIRPVGYVASGAARQLPPGLKAELAPSGGRPGASSRPNTHTSTCMV